MLSLALLLLVWAISGIGAVDIDNLVYKALPAEAACVRLLTRRGQVGCSISDGRGVLYDADDVLHGRVYDAVDPVAVLLPYSSLNQTMIATLKDRCKLAGLLVHSLAKASASDFPSPAEKSPFSYLSPDSREHIWNPQGTNLTGLEFDFAIVSVNDGDLPALQKRIEQNRQRIQQGSDPRNQAQFNYRMDASGNSINCLSSGTCLPIGGYSVWTSRGDNKNLTPIVAAVAQLDTSALIHTQAIGANTALSGLLALLGSSDVVAKVAETDLQKRIVFAAFNGEFYDLIGSRSFVKDLTSFTCTSPASDSGTQCLNPYRADTAFTNISSLVHSGSSIIDINQVGNGLLTDPFYFHTTSSALSSAVNAVATDQPMRTLSASAVQTIGLPPSSAWAFPSSVEKLVLAGFDTEFTSQLYGSDLDTALSDVALQRICSASTISSRTLLNLAGYTNPLTVSANCTLIKELADCLGPLGFDCPLARRVMSSSAIAASASSTKGAVSHYASVYQPLPSAQVFDTPRLINDWWASLGLSAHYHDAVDPDLSIGSDGFWHAADGSGRLWTESNWMRQRVRLYVIEAPWAGAFMLASGCVVAIAAITSSYFLSKFAVETIKMQ